MLTIRIPPNIDTTSPCGGNAAPKAFAIFKTNLLNVYFETIHHAFPTRPRNERILDNKWPVLHYPSETQK